MLKVYVLQSYRYLFVMWPVYLPTRSRSKLFSSLNDSSWLRKGCTAADNSSVSVRPCSIKYLHPSPEHRTRSSLQVSCCSYIFLIPEEKVLKKMNVRCNRNWLTAQPVRIHSTSFFSLKLSHIIHGVYLGTVTGDLYTHTQHSRMETFNYSIAWQCTIM